ncbi:MAG TPA: iron ABC transporter permease [bacterium]|nr:iron ABC transporter permease [bacterium]
MEPAASRPALLRAASPWISYAAVAAVAVALLGYVVLPLLATFREGVRGPHGLTAEQYRAFFSLAHPANLESLRTSLWISILSVLTCGTVGVTLAFLLNRIEFPGRRALEIVSLVPLALPPLIGVYTFVFLYAESGIVPRGLQAIFHLHAAPFALRGLVGVVVVHTFTMYPYFYLAAAAALAGLDPSLEEAAGNLGAGRWHVWTRVILPLLTPALVAGSLLVFMVSMASYTAPLIFGVDRTMTMQIYISRTNGDLTLASVQATILSAVSIGFLVAMRWYQGRRIYRSLSKGTAAARAEVRHPMARALVVSAAALLVLILIAPILVLVLISFSKDATWTVQVLPPVYTLQNYTRLVTDRQTWLPIRNSLDMSTLSTLGDVLLGVAAAYVIARLAIRGKGLLDIAVMLPWALPGTVVGINLITAFNQPSVFSLGRILVGTFWILPLAYFVRGLPLVFRSTSATMAQLDPALEEAAANLGASWWYAFRRVTLPLIGRGVLAGALLAFAQGVGEFVASILIYTPASRPLSVAIYNELYSFQFGTAAAYGVFQVLIVLVVLTIVRGPSRNGTLPMG